MKLDENVYASSGEKRLNSREQRAVAMYRAGASITGISRGLGLPVDHLLEILNLSKDDHKYEYEEAKSATNTSGLDNPLITKRQRFSRVADNNENPYVRKV